MAAITNIPKVKKSKSELEKELKEFSIRNRNPEKATEELYGLWENRKISIEKIRKKNNKNKWL